MLTRIFKKAVKEIAYPMAYAMGVDAVLQKIARYQNLVIMYHGVSANKCFDINGRHLPAVEFEKHLRYYKKHFNIVPLHQIALIRQQKQTTKLPTIALTFDDGYSNNLDVALPLLEKHNIPATFFITTAPTDKDGYILGGDLIEMGCAFSVKNEVSLGNTLFKKRNKYRWYSQQGQSIYDFFQRHSPAEKQNLIAEWKERYISNAQIGKLDKQCFELMNEGQIKQLASSRLVEIGSHTHSHHYLNLLNEEDLKFELAHSKNVLEKITGSKIESIAFPDGYYDTRVIEGCTREGYKNLVSLGLNTKKDKINTNLFPRVGSSNTTGMAFNMITISMFFNIHGF